MVGGIASVMVFLEDKDPVAPKRLTCRSGGYDWGKLFYLQLEFFCLQLSFFAYSLLRPFLDALSHCKQKSSPCK